MYDAWLSFTSERCVYISSFLQPDNLEIIFGYFSKMKRLIISYYGTRKKSSTLSCRDSAKQLYGTSLQCQIKTKSIALKAILSSFQVHLL